MSACTIQYALMLLPHCDPELSVPWQKTQHTDDAWCTYTDPEIMLRAVRERCPGKGIDVDTFLISMNHVDRAITDGEEDGFAKVHVKRN